MRPDLRVESIPLDRVLPYAENARTHSAAQVAQIAASIAEFGFVNPVLVDADGVLIAGHGRVMAARRLGLATVPALRLGHLSPAQARALRLADNQIALNSGWDETLLAAEIARIRDEAVVDLDVLGFSGMELDRLLAAAEDGFDGDADDAPPPPAVPVTRAGDLWCCGDHRLLCGDATVLADVQRALGDRCLADMAWTDPPYNVAYEGGTAARMTIANDALGASFLDFLRPALANLLQVTKGACYVCMSSSEWPTLHRAWQEAGGKWSSTIIWAKNTFALGRADYHQQFEAMLYGWRRGAQHYWCGARDQGNVWHYDKPARNELHPTMKPVALVERATLGDLLKYELNGNYSREVVTLKGGTLYPLGAVLGKITASGIYRLSPAAAVTGDEGAETAVAVLIEAVDATVGDRSGLVVARGPAIVSKGALVFDASVDQPAEIAAKHAELSAAGVVPRDTA